jgi:hypothetical protein
VDAIRLPYEENLIFSPGVETRVAWYLVPNDTPILPYITPFRSGKWLERPWANTLGPAYPSLWPWRPNTRYRPLATGTPIGTAEQWLNGLQPGTPYVPIVPPGVPAGTQGNIAWTTAQAVSRWLAAARVRARGYASPKAGVSFSASAVTNSRPIATPHVLLLGGASASTRATASSSPDAAFAGGASASTRATASSSPDAAFAGGASASTRATASSSPDVAFSAGGSAVTSAKGHSTPDGQGAFSAKAATAAFSVVTPGGGCGSLPSSVVVRFSGCTGGAADLNGTAMTMAYNSGLFEWTGTTGSVLTLTNWLIACHLGAFNLGCNGYHTTTTGIVLSGTTGSTPALTGTGPVTTPSAGNVTAALTRT